jgi:hypothetical protein
MLIREALFNGSWPKLTTHAIEKCLKIRISSFVHPSKIFVWGAYSCKMGLQKHTQMTWRCATI